MLLAGTSLFADIDRISRKEIEYLFNRLEQSGCRFGRNGSWHTPREASLHLRKKLDYLLDRNLVSSAEDFIKRAATKSSISGRFYQVQCGQGAVLQSSVWFFSELREYRSHKK